MFCMIKKYLTAIISTLIVIVIFGVAYITTKYVVAYSTVVETGAGATVSMVLSSSNKPIIVYQDNMVTGNLMIDICDDSLCTSSGVTTVTLDGNNNSTGYFDLLLDQNGYPVVAYVTSTSGVSTLKLVFCQDSLCSSISSPVTLDSSINTDTNVSISVNSSGIPIVAYQDITNEIKVAVCGNTTCSSGNTTQILDAGPISTNAGVYIDIQPSTDIPFVSYIDASNTILKLAYCGNTACSSGNTIVTLDTSAGITVANNSFSFNASNIPTVAYADSTDLAISVCSDTTCSGNTEYYNRAIGSIIWPSINFNVYPVIVYNDGTDIKLMQCGDAICTPASATYITLDTGVNPSGAISFVFSPTYIPFIAFSDGGDVTLGSYYVSIIIQAGGSTDVIEGGATDTFTVELSDAPSADVTVTLDTDNGEVTLNGQSVSLDLTFTSLNFDTPQTVTVEAIDDTDVEGTHYDYIDYILSSADTNYDGMFINDEITVNITDNDSISVIVSNDTRGGNVLRRLFLDKGNNRIPLICPYFIDFLRRGDRDGVRGKQDVAKLQNFLNERGHIINSTSRGIFGPKTEKALKSWQGVFTNDVLSVWRAFLQPTGYFYQSSRHVANKQVGCTNITTVLDNGVVLQ